MSKRKRKNVVGKTAKKNRSTTNYKRNYPKSYLRKSSEVSRVTQLLWAVCLIVLGVSGVLFGIFGFIGVQMPDWLICSIGIADIVALPVLAITTIQKLKYAE